MKLGNCSRQHSGMGPSLNSPSLWLLLELLSFGSLKLFYFFLHDLLILHVKSYHFLLFKLSRTFHLQSEPKQKFLERGDFLRLLICGNTAEADKTQLQCSEITCSSRYITSSLGKLACVFLSEFLITIFYFLLQSFLSDILCFSV